MLDSYRDWSELALLAAAVIAGALAGQKVTTAAREFVPAGRDRIAEPPIRRRRLWVSPMLAGLFAVLTLRLGETWALPAYWFFTAAGTLLALVDLEHQLLPNKIVFGSLGSSVVLLTLAAALDDSWPALARAVTGGIALFALYLILALVSPTALGMGDVKFAAVIGVFLAFRGWETLLFGTLAGFAAGGVVSAWLLLRRKADSGGKVAYGPSMMLGAFISLLLP